MALPLDINGLLRNGQIFFAKQLNVAPKTLQKNRKCYKNRWFSFHGRYPILSFRSSRAQMSTDHLKNFHAFNKRRIDSLIRRLALYEEIQIKKSQIWFLTWIKIQGLSAGQNTRCEVMLASMKRSAKSIVSPSWRVKLSFHSHVMSASWECLKAERLCRSYLTCYCAMENIGPKILPVTVSWWRRWDFRLNNTADCGVGWYQQKDGNKLA